MKHSKYLLVVALLTILLADAAQAARIARLPRLKLKSYEAGYGSPKGVAVELNVSCLNISPFDQKLYVKSKFEAIKMGLCVKNIDKIGVNAPWKNSATTPDWYSADKDLGESLTSGRTSKTMILKPMGDVNGDDNKEVGLGFTCVNKLKEFKCKTGDPTIISEFDFRRSTRQADGSLDCGTTKDCIIDANVYYEVTSWIELDEASTRGAVLCSLYTSANLSHSENQVTGEINVAFNGGNPF